MTFRGLEIEYELYNKVVRMLNRKFQINHNNNYNQQNNNYNHNQSSVYENSHYDPSCYVNNNNGYKYDRNNKEKYIRNKNNKDCNETVLNEDKSIYDIVEKKISTNLNLRDRNENKYEESFNNDKNTHYSKKDFQNKNTRNNNYNRNVYEHSVYGNKGNKNKKEFECEFNY